MSPTTAPDHPSLADQLPPNTYYHLIHTLCLTLPSPLTESPEDLAHRDHFAIARIAALRPTNAAEADQAALYVAASEQWKDCLRLAQQPGTTPQRAMKCRAQANAMMRQSQGALRLLFRMQATRQKQEGNQEAGDRAARTIGLTAEAPSPQAAPATIAEPLAPQPKPEPKPLKQPRPDPLPAVGQSAAISPRTSALTRPIGPVAGPTARDLLLSTAYTPAFAVLDRCFAETRAAWRERRAVFAALQPALAPPEKTFVAFPSFASFVSKPDLAPRKAMELPRQPAKSSMTSLRSP